MTTQLVMVSGMATTGKSWSLKDIKDHSGVVYMCTEANKNLPFKNNFQSLNITDPEQVVQAFEEVEDMPNVHTIVVDSLTFMLDQMETKYVQEVEDSRGGWGVFAEFFKVLMLRTVASSTKNVLFTAHTLNIYNAADRVMECKIPVKGSLKNNGIESYFSVIISTKRMSLDDLEGYENDLLIITPDELDLGFKHVFQTRLTKDTINERIRSPDMMWSKAESFIDNNIQFVLDRLHKYYS